MFGTVRSKLIRFAATLLIRVSGRVLSNSDVLVPLVVSQFLRRETMGRWSHTRWVSIPGHVGCNGNTISHGRRAFVTVK